MDFSDTDAGILAHFSGCTVLVLGDVMLDRYVQGEVRRISPEAPIPVLRAQQRRAVLGGAANVARNVTSLGARAVIVGVVGEDAAAVEMADLLHRGARVTARLVTDPERPTTVKTRFMSGSHQILRLDEEVADPISPTVESALLDAFRAALAEADVVVLSDYAKGVLTDHVLAAAIAMAREAGRPVIADPKRGHFAAYHGVTLLTPNEAEVTRATGILATDDVSVDEAGKRALAQAGAPAVLITRSEKGMTLVRETDPPLHLPTRAQSVADVSGAGDTVVAALAIMLACDASLPLAASMANVAAGISVGKAGTATVAHAELAEALHRRELLAVDHKVATLDMALGADRDLAWGGPADRFHQWLLRPDPSRPRPSAAQGARRLRPPRGGAELRRLGAPAEGADAAGAERDRAGHRDGLDGRGGSGGAVRGGHADEADRGDPAGSAVQGGGLHDGSGGRRRVRAPPWRTGGADRSGGGAQHHRHYPPHRRRAGRLSRRRAHIVSAQAYPDFALSFLLPLSRDRFADRVHGGFHEQLDATGRKVEMGSKRVMVQCRQLYVLSHAALLGERSGEVVAEAGFAFLCRAYQDRVHGGWFFRASEAGEPTDRHKDFYAHAFVLFALAYLHRAFAAPRAMELARETYAVMQERLAAPGGGFWDAATEEWRPVMGMRRQNPHMHLLEALHALYEASGDSAWLGEASAIVGLFRRHFFEPRSATLGEFFADDWGQHPQRGHLVEAGHHFEWVWLLHRHAELTGTPVDEAADALFAVAWRHGFDAEHGGIHDVIDRAGQPVERTRRIWPVTEAIKACVVRLEAGFSVPPGQPAGLIAHLFDDFIHPAGFGWVERMSREGTPLQTTLPGSTPYHLFLAAAEVGRVMGATTADIAAIG